MPPSSRPPERYERPPSARRAAVLLVWTVVAYLAAAGLTVTVLLGLDRFSPLQTAGLGLLVALAVVVGRSCLAGARAARGRADPPD